MALDTEKLTAELEALQKQRQLVSESLRSLNGRGRGRGAFGHHQVGGGRFGGRGGPRGPWGGSGREPEGDGSEAQGPRGLGDSTGRVSREAPSGRAEPGKEEGQQPRQWREAAADRTGSGTGHAWRRADGLVGRCWQPAAAAERGGEAGPGAGLESSRAAGRGLGGPWGGGTEQRGRAREAAAGAKDAAGAPAARKRLLSAVVAPDGSLPPDEAEAGEWQTEQNEAKRQKRAEMEAAPDMQKRNRRMFGALLGTLSSFRKEASDFSSSSSAQRQHAALQRAEARRRKLSQEAAAAARLEMEEKRNQHHDVLRKLNLDADKKRLELQYAHRIAHEKALLAFCRTKTRPAVFWLPVEVKEDSAAAEQLHRQRAAWPQQQAALVEALEREKMKLEEAAREWRKRRLQHLSQRNAARVAAAADAGAAADAAPPPGRATRHENTRPAPEPGSRRSQSGEDSDADGDELLPTVDMEVEPEADDDAPDEGGDHDEQLHDPAAAAAAAEDRYRPDAAGNPDSDGADADDHQTDP